MQHTRLLEGSFATLGEVMDAAVEQFADAEAYVEAKRRATYGEWLADADALAAELYERGVRRGDVVALMLPSSIDFAVGYAAAVKIGAIVSGLNTRIGRREVSSILRQAAPAIVLRDEDLALPELPPDVAVLPRSELAEIYRRGGRPPRVDTRPEDIVTITWTSGTTGDPKGVCLDHANHQAISDAAGVMSAPRDRRLVSTPFAHAGYMAKVWDQLMRGLAIVISPATKSAGERLRQIVDERITVVGAVPTQWERLLRLPELDGTDLSHVRIGTSATAPIRPEVVEEVRARMGFPLVVRYAMTESPTICGTEPEDPPEVQSRTVGRPQQGVEIRINAPDGEIGRIDVRSGCVMRGYWNAPELTRAALGDDGWLRSGDLGYLREDGNLVLAGRATDMYIRGGYNVYPTEVETVLATHPGVEAVSVIGSPAPRIGEIGVAFVVPADPARPPALEELRELAKRELADYKAPDRLEIVERLPVNTLLKVDKRALRELAAKTADTP